jgi:hypothetical protein
MINKTLTAAGVGFGFEDPLHHVPVDGEAFQLNTPPQKKTNRISTKEKTKHT